jgi:5-methylcytosine-specific restriction endonuclease McrA
MTGFSDRTREQIKARDRFLCVRCGTRGEQAHHRRSRGVPGLHQNCVCNGVWLCMTCHTWVHANPFLARGRGLIVPRYADPRRNPGADRVRYVLIDCDGAYAFAPEMEG